ILIEPLLPPERPKPKSGRPPLPPRAALSGIIFVPKIGIPWEILPRRWAAARDDLLAAVARLASRRGLGKAVWRPARLLGPGGCHRLEPCLRGQCVHCG